MFTVNTEGNVGTCVGKISVDLSNLMPVNYPHVQMYVYLAD